MTWDNYIFHYVQFNGHFPLWILVLICTTHLIVLYYTDVGNGDCRCQRFYLCPLLFWLLPDMFVNCFCCCSLQGVINLFDGKRSLKINIYHRPFRRWVLRLLPIELLLELRWQDACNTWIGFNIFNAHFLYYTLYMQFLFCMTLAAALATPLLLLLRKRVYGSKWWQ